MLIKIIEMLMVIVAHFCQAALWLVIDLQYVHLICVMDMFPILLGE